MSDLIRGTDIFFGEDAKEEGGSASREMSLYARSVCLQHARMHKLWL